MKAQPSRLFAILFIAEYVDIYIVHDFVVISRNEAFSTFSTMSTMVTMSTMWLDWLDLPPMTSYFPSKAICTYWNTFRPICWMDGTAMSDGPTSTAVLINIPSPITTDTIFLNYFPNILF